jgi:hypothetical protein
VQLRVLREPLLKVKYLFAYGDYRRRAADLTPPGIAAPYFDPQALKVHSWGVVLEKNWGDRFKLALESNLLYNQQGTGPGVNALAELNYLLTYHLSVRGVAYYSHSVGLGGVSYQVRSVSGGLSYRF